MATLGYGSNTAVRQAGQSRIWLILALAAVCAFLAYYCYVEVISESPIFRTTGAIAVYPEPFAPWLGIAFCLLPLTWLRRTVLQPSDFVILYIYFFLFIPTCVMLAFVSQSDLTTQFIYLLAITLGFGFVEFRRIMRPMRLADFSMPEVTFEWLLMGLAVVVLGLLLTMGEVQFSNISFFDVYERRARLMAEGSGASPLVFYSGNWGGLAIAPVMMVYGLERKRFIMVGLGVMLALVSFLATSFKAHIFIPIFTLGYYYMFKIFSVKRSWEIIAASFMAICVFSMAVDYMVNYAPFVTWSFQFRLIGNNGFLSAQYLDFFYHMPKGLFADSFGRILTDPVYNRPIAMVVGESFSAVTGNHANASFWADGFGNLGFFGIFFVSVELLLFLWLLDSVSAGKSLLTAISTLTPVAFSLANTSVHSTFSSNGAILIFLLLMLMPRTVRAAPAPSVPRGTVNLVSAEERPTSQQ